MHGAELKKKSSNTCNNFFMVSRLRKKFSINILGFELDKALCASYVNTGIEAKNKIAPFITLYPETPFVSHATGQMRETSSFRDRTQQKTPSKILDFICRVVFG